MTHKAVNWDRKHDDFTQVFWEQNIRQFWVDTEIPVSKDTRSWAAMSEDEKDVYKKVLGGLTLLDTKQANVGMPKILDHVEDLQRKSVLSFMSMMENIHAKSYSTIFTTLMERSEIDEVFLWIEDEPSLQKKYDLIETQYENISDKKSLYKAMASSVFLESFLFYSGFFYPLYLAGHGRMVQSGEIINLILRDESIHGVFVGLLSQEIKDSLTREEQRDLDEWVHNHLYELMENEEVYTDEIYSKIDLDVEVKRFIRYNANKALMNLGYEPVYEDVEINSIVENGLDTDTKTHDFFSTKGNGYVKSKQEEITDDIFEF